MEDTTNNKPGVIYVPWVTAEHTEESLADYKAFMANYKEQHECCPICGSDSCLSTLMGYVMHADKRDQYRDMNRCTCTACGDVHIRHDRVPKQERTPDNI